MNKKYAGLHGLNSETPHRKQLLEYYKNSLGDDEIKISNFAKYAKMIDLQTFLFKTEIFKKIINVHGSIMEMGVFFGGGLMTWAKLSSILEPLNYQRKIIGFDTFSGFPSICSKDKLSINVKKNYNMKSCKKGEFKADCLDDINQSIKLYDQERYYFNDKKIELVKGDVKFTVSKYIRNNPHLIVSLLNLDLDLYRPTKTALKHVVKRMPKGAIICFDEINHPNYPGETLAVIEELGINNLKIQRFEFAPRQSYAILE